MSEDSSFPPKQPPQPQSSTSDSQNAPAQSQQQQNQFQQQQQQFLAAPTRQKPGSKSDGGFFHKYHAPVGSFDEFQDAERQVRPHWKNLDSELSRIGDLGVDHRDQQVRRMVRENGIAFSAYGDPSVREHHLQLGPIPQLISAQEWGQIEKALRQRATLLNLMLKDLYGPRELLKQGVIPTEVLFAHPHYQFSYYDLPFQDGQYLHFYAAEMIRSPQGNWWIKSDRTDSPGGSGFALENRIAISRAFPDAFRYCSVKQLAPYFLALREHLVKLAKTNRANPQIAILTSGAGSERYFEDSFLATYLGLTLVEVNDLVVRSGKVMLKTLAGLSQVDVIFRRRPSSSLDPLELGGGVPGVPGILQVIRKNQVVVVNTPGSGLVESPIFMAFLPRICQALLKADLMLPGIATWWGGEPDSLRLMLDRIDELRLLPAYRIRFVDGKRPTNVSAELAKTKWLKPEAMTRDERIRLLQSNPSHWVGQEKVSRSSSPVWNSGKLAPGYITLRTFLTAIDKQWQAIPGGLVRVSESPQESSRNPFEGGGTKDAWVVSSPGVAGVKQAEPTSLQKKKRKLSTTNSRARILAKPNCRQSVLVGSVLGTR